MKEIYINADDYNSDSIRTIQGNNNAEEYKIYLQYDNEKIDLTGKTVNLGFLRVGSTEGDIIENLNVTNPKEGEITLKITNKISKRNGTYSCQLAILGEGDFLEHTATFTLTVENNIFSDITKAIADSKDFTYLENILDKASKLSEKLKENTSSATNANSNLESNIIEANNINSKLLENTSTATSLNKNLESNIDLAKEVKETIKDLDAKNTEATSNIGQLKNLNAKAEELSNNIQQGLPLNSELVKNVESAKTVNNELIATNNDAKAKKTDLDNSLEEAKKYIAGLDGSKNPVQMQLDIDMLKNGLKSNQALAYKGSSITANNTLDGRTECMKIKGKTLLNLIKGGKGTFVIDKSKNPDKRIFTFAPTYSLKKGKRYVGYVVINSIENVESGLRIYGYSSKSDTSGGYITCARNIGINKFEWNTNLFPESTKDIDTVYLYVEGNEFNNNGKLTFSNFMLFEEGTDLTYIDEYFEGIKGFGEAEQEGDKYKISLLSHGKNFIKLNELDDWNSGSLKPSFKCNNGEFSYSVGENDKVGRAIEKKISIKKGVNLVLSLQAKSTFVDGGSSWVGIYYRIGSNWNYFGHYITPNTAYKKFEFKGVVPNEAEECVLRIYNYSQKSGTSYFKDIQVEEGEVATSCEVYREDKKYILIKESLRDDDMLYEDDGKVKIYRDSKKYVITGNEEWSQYVDNSDFTCMGFFLQLNKDFDAKLGGKFICNNFKGSDTDVFPGNITVDDEIIFVKGRSGEASPSYIKISISKSKLTTQNVEGFKEWLKANPTEIIYQLATPVVEIVDGLIDIDLDTYQEKTYFSIENSLPGTLDFKVPSNIGSVVQNMSKEVNNIWDVINNLLVPSIVKANGNLAMIKLNNNLK
ncbi:BppU family phage baseplate upper protein [Clostridium perfringens]|nr:BppU family phage baseplate upper protein [Clostridium perfringens]